MRLWLELRGGRFHGIKFRRQKVINRHIADFASNDPRLIIELDGNTHANQAGYDAERTRDLEAQGYRVVRFTNVDVVQNMDGILHRLGEIVETLHHAPPPTPSPEGEGAGPLSAPPPTPSPEGEGA